MNRSSQMLLAVAVVIVAGGCQQKDSSPIKTTSAGETNVSPPADSLKARGHSLVRMVNAVTAGGDVTVQISDQPLFRDVKPGSVTDYREIANTLADFSVRAAGIADGFMIAEKERLLRDGNRYTVFLIAENLSKSTLRVVHDNVIPDSGKARIRVIHAAPGGPALDVSIVGATDKLFSGVNFTREAGFKDVAPGSVTLELKAKDSPKVLLRLPAIELERGTATTIVVTGASKLGFFKFTDALMAKTPRP
jgi:hypothetical protein